MSVPKASVNKYGESSRNKNNVGRTGQLLPMETESISKSVHGAPNDQLRRSVPGADSLHDTSTLFGSPCIGHRFSEWRDIDQIRPVEDTRTTLHFSDRIWRTLFKVSANFIFHVGWKQSIKVSVSDCL